MRRISWFASVRSRTVSFVAIVLLGNAVAWLVFLGPLRSHGQSTSVAHRPKVHAHSTTQPVDDLHLVAAQQSNYDWRTGAVELLITLNKPVEPATILRRLQLLEENAHLVPIHLTSQSPWAMSRTVSVETEPMPRLEATEDASMKLSLLRSAAVDKIVSLDILGNPLDVSIATDQRITAVFADSTHEQNQSIRVHFSAPVDLAVLRPAISVEPAVAFTINPNGAHEVLLNGPFKAATRYAVKISQRSENQDSKVVPRGGVCTVFLPDRPADVWFDHGSGFLSSSGSRRITVHAINVAQLTVTISKLYDSNLVVWRNLQDQHSSFGRRRRYQTQDTSIDNQGRVVGTKQIALTTQKNQEQQRDLSLDELLPSEMRSDGVFRIDVAGKAVGGLVGGLVGGEVDSDYADESFMPSATTLLTLSDVALTVKHSANELVVWATSLHSAKPLNAVHVRAFTGENQLAAEAVTDESGIAHLPGASADGHPVQIVLADSNSQLSWLDLRDPPLATDNESVHGAPYRPNGYDAFVYADRGVYRPGETVHLRTVVRDAQQKAPHQFPVQFTLRGAG